jgi:hypothetical protein
VNVQTAEVVPLLELALIRHILMKLGKALFRYTSPVPLFVSLAAPLSFLDGVVSPRKQGAHCTSPARSLGYHMRPGNDHRESSPV